MVCPVHGTLVDGKKFDSSYKRGQPARSRSRGVVEAVQPGAAGSCRSGSKSQVGHRLDLAYSARRRGYDIKPDATLVFEIEFVAISGGRRSVYFAETAATGSVTGRGYHASPAGQPPPSQIDPVHGSSDAPLTLV